MLKTLCQSRRLKASALWLALGLLTSLSAVATTDLVPLEPTKQQQKTAAEIVETLHQHHYRDQSIDDTLSAKFLDNYLDNLDPSRSYFLQTDIDEFHKHSDQFDDDFKKGELGTSFEIFDRYRKRISTRLKSTLEQLKDDEHQYDFNKDGHLNTDRENADWPATAAEANELWRKRTKADLLNLILADKSIEEAREVLLKRHQNQLRRLSQQTGEDAFSAIINAFTMLYDPHTNYLSPRTLENFNINMSLSLEGIGAMLQSEDEYTKIVRLIPAGPADKQGQLKPADRIVAVGQGKDGELVDVVGWRLDEVVDLIRGKKDSLVRLEVLPSKAAAGAATHIVSIKRDKVKLEEQAAQKAVFELTDKNNQAYNIGVIDIPTFYMDFEAYRKRDPNYKSTTRDVFNLLGELTDENVDGIIIDLRNNGGGSLHEATNLTDLFIDQGPVVQIRQTNQLISRNYRSRSKALFRGPIVVLINRLSASASEIFAGAIQDYGRGIIVGSQSFGKGSVQSLQPLQSGQLKITESKFYRVSGGSTQHRGVVPDIRLPDSIDPDEVGESSYDYALPWDQIHAVKHSHYFDFEALLPSIKKAHKARIKTDPDFVFLSAQQALIEQNSNRTSVSLNANTRRTEKSQYEQQLLSIENARRKSRGLKPYEQYADISKDDINKQADSQEQSAAEAEAAAGPQKINPEKDPLLTEAGYILLDFIRGTRSADKSKDETKVANF